MTACRHQRLTRPCSHAGWHPRAPKGPLCRYQLHLTQSVGDASVSAIRYRGRRGSHPLGVVAGSRGQGSPCPQATAVATGAGGEACCVLRVSYCYRRGGGDYWGVSRRSMVMILYGSSTGVHVHGEKRGRRGSSCHHEDAARSVCRLAAGCTLASIDVFSGSGLLETHRTVGVDTPLHRLRSGRVLKPLGR